MHIILLLYIKINTDVIKIKDKSDSFKSEYISNSGF